MKKIKRYLLVLAVVLALGVFLTACNSSRNNTSNSPSTPDSTKQQDGTATENPPVEQIEPSIKKDVVYATNPIGTGNYTYAAAHAAVWGDTLGINVTVEPTSGAEGCVYALEDGSDLAIVSGYYAKQYWTAGVEDSFKVVRSMVVGDPLCFSFVVNADSGIQSVEDLAGKRVTYSGLSSAHTIMAEAILKAYNISPDMITVLAMSSSGAGLVDLAEGRTDAVIASIAGSKMDELAAKITPYVLEYDDEHAQAIAEISEGLLAGAILRSDLPGSHAGAYLLGSVNQIICRADVDADTIYALTKANLENTAAHTAIAEDLQYWDATTAVTVNAMYPYHEGAIRYFKEAGIWTDEMEEWNNALLTQYSCEK